MKLPVILIRLMFLIFIHQLQAVLILRERLDLLRMCGAVKHRHHHLLEVEVTMI